MSSFTIWFWNCKQLTPARVNELIMAGEIAAFFLRELKTFFLYVSVSNSPEKFEVVEFCVCVCVCVKGKMR